jgi:glyoxylate reductase
MADQKKVLVLCRVPEDVANRLERDYDVRLNQRNEPYDHARIVAEAAGRDALVTTSSNKMTAEVIAALPDSVRIIGNISVGYEHIDVAAAQARGLVVTNTPDVLTEATAEIAMLLLLGAARRAAEGGELMRQGTWKGSVLDFNLGVGLTGKNLGVLGMGRIGQALAHRAAAFGMEIHYHNRNRLDAEREAYAGNATYHESADSLLPISQFLSIHSPLTPETHHFLNARRIDKLPHGAIVVNTSRGDVVDDEALIAALTSGKVRAAGLDVFSGEPNFNPAYRELKGAFLLPHIGSATVETRNAMGFCAIDNLDAYFAGKGALTPIT